MCRLPLLRAPENLDQTILPGWVFGSVINVIEENSAAPQAEAAILRSFSYGRQLGQIADALQVLIDERPAGADPSDGAIAKFVTMRADVEKRKTDAVTAGGDRFLDELDALRQKDPDSFQQARTRLRTLLE